MTHEKLRFQSLDAMRGLAALGVLLTHCLQQFVADGTLNHTPLRMLVNGRSFVIFFFVLSGFVLALSIWNEAGKSSYPTYLARRFVRLYPAYVIAGLAGFLVTVLAGNADISHLMAHLLAFGTDNGISINVPSWSLVYELRLSALMPLICLIISRNVQLSAVLAIVLFIAEEIAIVSTGIGQFAFGAETLSNAIVATAHFSISFIVGALLAYDWKHDRKAFKVVARFPAVAAGFAYLLMSILLDQASILGGVILIILAVQWGGIQGMLNTAPLQWLGRISYSLYLTHMVLISALNEMFVGAVPPFAVAIIALPLALVVAEVFYRLVEKPSITLSKKIRRSARTAQDDEMAPPPGLKAHLQPAPIAPRG